MKTLGKILKDVEFLMDAVVNDYQPKEKKTSEYTPDFMAFYKLYGINKTKHNAFTKWNKIRHYVPDLWNVSYNFPTMSVFSKKNFDPKTFCNFFITRNRNLCKSFNFLYF